MIHIALKKASKPMDRSKKIVKFATNAMLYIVMADLNRIKVVLVEKKRTNKMAGSAVR